MTARNSRTNIADMNNIRQIRQLLGLSQAAFGDAIGVTQGNVSFYEMGGQDVPPKVARRLIEVAAKRGHELTFDDIYSTSREQAA